MATPTNHSDENNSDSAGVSDSSASTLVTPSALFSKKVDWQLLHNGFTIPENAVDSFCSNISDDDQRRNSFYISIRIKGTLHTVTLSRNWYPGIASTVWQVAYSPNSSIAKHLRKIFASTYNFEETNINGKVDESNVDKFIEVFCVSPGVFEIKCFPLVEESDKKIETTDANANTLSTIEDRYLVIKTHSKSRNDSDIARLSKANVKAALIEYSTKYKGKSN